MDLHAKARQRLCDLNPNRAHPYNSDPPGQVGLLEECIRGQHAIAEGAPRFRDNRAGAGRQHDLARFYGLLTDDEPVLAVEPRPSGDQAWPELVGRFQDTGNKLVA